MPPTVRRFPTPWTVHHNEDAFWVQDATGQKFAFTYFHDRALVGTSSDVRVTREEARRIATNVARLPELLKKGGA